MPDAFLRFSDASYFAGKATTQAVRRGIDLDEAILSTFIGRRYRIEILSHLGQLAPRLCPKWDNI